MPAKTLVENLDRSETEQSFSKEKNKLTFQEWVKKKDTEERLKKKLIKDAKDELRSRVIEEVKLE